MRIQDHPPRQLGSLRDRMSFVIEQAIESGVDSSSVELWHAIWDLASLVESVPDMAFRDRLFRVPGQSQIVPADSKDAKRGLEPRKKKGG